MKIRVTIEAEVPDEVPGYSGTIRAVQMTIADAFGEFITPRIDPIAYVETRYDYLTQAKKDEKMAQVRARLDIAEALMCRIHGEFGSIKIEKLDDNS